MNFSNESLMMLLNGERNINIEIKTEKMLKLIINNLFNVYSRYMLWSYDEFESAVNFLEKEFEQRKKYFNTTHEGILNE